jgi:hypothetical protein
MRPHRDADGAVGLCERAPRLDEKQASGIGKLDMPAGSVQEPNSELFFQTADLLAQRRLRDAKPLCRAPEVQRLPDGDEVAEVSEFHESIS